MPAQVQTQGKRINTSAATRAKVVEAAAALFRHHGYEAVTIRSVAAAAGVSTGSIFSHFTGKEELFTAAIGEPPPDVPAFLQKVVEANMAADDHSEASTALEQLALEAERLRRAIVGNHA